MAAPVGAPVAIGGGALAVASVGAIVEGGADVATGVGVFASALRSSGGGGPPPKPSYRETFFSEHPELRGKVVVHHAIEQQVLKRYPGLFTESEIHALENLRGIPKSTNARLHLSEIRKAWNEFYRTNASPTRQQIIDFATNGQESRLKFPTSKVSMGYVKISPEVAGSLGENTRMNTTVHPPIVTHLHHQFESWLGDDLLELFPCFLVTARLAEALEASQLTGFALATAEVSASEEFEDMQPGTELPTLRWLQITGAFPDEKDFRLTPEHRLEISERALTLLRSFQLENASLE